MSGRTSLSAIGIGVVGMLFCTSVSLGDVKLSAMFSDHMVLQQGMPVPVWGWAKPGEQVTVKFGEQSAAATADDAGKWQVKLQPLQAGGPHELTVSGNNAITLNDVLVGEVWVCSGQSNMEFAVAGAKNAQQEIQDANYGQIRLYTVPRTIAAKPLSDTHGSWAVCRPMTTGGFSAVGYFFGRDLYKTLNVPIGLIHTSWGGTPAEAWTARPMLEDDPDLTPILDRWQHQVDTFKQRVKELADQIDKSGNIEDGTPLPQDPRGNPWRPAGLFNGMIAPVTPFAIRGATWYQGESNADRAYQYRKLLPAMIKSWRSNWDEGDFPFLIVSLANFTPPPAEPGESDWAELREAQAMTAAQPHNGLAVTIDVGDAADIHPKDKQTVGARLALTAEATVYGRRVEYSGPWYDSMKVDGDQIVLTFKHADGGLEARGSEALKGFAIAGEDRKWRWADARIQGDTVVVRCSEVPHPVAVRYAWANNPPCNLYNSAGLPAVPFRTDDWKGVTADKK